MLKVDQYEFIRTSYRVYGKRIKELARETGHSKNTRILLTLDEHFGDWVILPLSRHPGVVRIKVHPTTTKKVIKHLLPFLSKHSPDQFKNHLVIVSEKRVKWIFTA